MQHAHAKTPVAQSWLLGHVFEVMCLLLFTGVPALAQSDCLRWFQVTSAGSPGPREGHAMAYDSDRGVTVLFGGASDSSGYLADNETWEYDGQAWKVIPITGSRPSRRSSHDMAYDSVRREFVMFGGLAEGSATQNDETWVFSSDGKVGTWTRRYPATVPDAYAGDSPGLQAHRMAFDTARGVTLMIGGIHWDNFFSEWLVAAETWEWNGVNWRESVFSNASRRVLHAIAFDSARGRGVVFGGWRRDWGEESTLAQGTLEYSDGTWTDIPSSTPALRYGHTMAFDNRRNKIVMFGGAAPGLGDDTDEYTAGIGWTSLLDTGPPARESHAMVYDSRRGVMVVYGGMDPAAVTSAFEAFDDTWELDVCTRPPEVVRWVDFAYIVGEERGTFAAPFNTLTEGVAALPAGGMLRIKAGATSEKQTISKPMTLSAYGGPVVIGQ